MIIAELYDPEGMPLDLQSAHESFDNILEECYMEGGFSSDEDRLEFMFNMYVNMTGGINA